MKRIFLIIGFSMFFLLGNAQDKSKNDSLVNVSRTKVDMILQEIGISSKVLVYSIEDSHYYIVTKDKCGYIERYVKLNSVNEIEKTKLLKTRRKGKKILKTAFTLKEYDRGLTIDLPEASYIRGKTSYFVVKDKNNNRYGEYRLPVFSLPPPINKDTYGYIVGRLSQEITKYKKGSE